MSQNSLYQWYTTCVTGVSVVSCVFVMHISYVIHRKTRKEYPWILGFNTFVDLMYTLANGIAMTICLITPTHAYLVTTNPLLQDAPPLLIDFVIVSHTYFMCLVPPNNAVHFWYRYNILCRGVVWSRQRYCLTYLVPVVLWFFFFMSFFFVRERMSEETIRDLYESGFFLKGDVPRHTGMRTDDLVALIGTVAYSAINTFYYIVMCYFGYQITRKMKEYSKRIINTTEKAQQKVVRVMILQAIYPVILFLLPNFVTNFLLLFDCKYEPLAYVAGCSVQLMPILSTATVILLVPSYRRHIWKRDSTVILSNTSRSHFGI